MTLPFGSFRVTRVPGSVAPPLTVIVLPERLIVYDPRLAFVGVGVPHCWCS